MILRLSRSVVPPQTPSRSRVASACSKHDKRTGQMWQMAFASSALSSESGKNTAGSRPLHAPRCLQVISIADTGFPPRCRGFPHARIVCVGCHRCPIRLRAVRFPYGRRSVSSSVLVVVFLVCYLVGSSGIPYARATTCNGCIAVRPVCSIIAVFAR